jgi:cobalt-precorrin-5B (C1)-methyltransferase
MAISGYTLPVFATAATIAALQHLQNKLSKNTVKIDLINPPELVNIDIEQVAKISDNQALAITRSEPGENFDITRNTPLWALVKIEPNQETEIIINGGEGIGKFRDKNGEPAIYKYAQELLEKNIIAHLDNPAKIEVTIILPEGKKLAQKTSNSAFGIIEGLSLLGTSGISQPLTSKDQLELYQQELTIKVKKFDNLVFCIGENGLNLAEKMGINPEQLVKTANWLGSMLATAGMLKLSSITLLGYHGKLIKLAGGIFHTHHYLADGRLEILTAHGAKLGLPTSILQKLFNAPTTESALVLLRELDSQNSTHWVTEIYASIATTIKQKSEDYIFKHSEQKVSVNVMLFDGNRQIIVKV